MTQFPLLVSLAVLMAYRVVSTPSAFNTRQSVNKTIALNVPDSPTAGRQVIDGAFQSYSIEFSCMADYAGNDSYANTKLSQADWRESSCSTF